MRAVPRICEFYPGICLTTEEKARKNLSQDRKTSVRAKKKPHFLYNINLLVIVKRTRVLYEVHTDLSVTINTNFSFQMFNL